MKKAIAFLAVLSIMISVISPLSVLAESFGNLLSSGETDVEAHGISEDFVHASDAAASVTSLAIDYTTDRLVLPEFNGMSVEILSSSDERLISVDGAANLAYGGAADIVLKITDAAGNTATTNAITVNVMGCMLEFSDVEGVQASSSHPVWPPYHMNNGDAMNGFWSNGDDAPREVEVVAELKESKTLHGVVLYPRYIEGNTYFPSDFEVFISSDKENWVSVKKVSDYRISDYKEAQTFYFDIRENAQYVKLVMDRGESPYVQIAELQVLTRMKEETITQAATNLLVQQSDDQLVFGGVSSQFRVNIIEAFPENILDPDGHITHPSEDTEVTVTLRIVNRLNTADVKSLTKKLVIKSMNTIRVEKVAQGIDLIPCPSNDATQLTFPSVPDGYSIEIADLSHPDVIDYTGRITRRDDETCGVRVTFRIIDNATGISALTAPLLVPIYKTYVAPTMSPEEIQVIHEKYEASAYGAFIHYISNYSAWGGTVYADGTPVLTVDEAANAFDAAAFAKSMHEFGVEYVLLTCWHGDTRTLFPSMTNQRWRDDRRAEDSTAKKSYSDRDVIMDLLDELDRYGIDLHLYTHPTDGHDFTVEDQLLTGATDATDEYAVWNQYINELYYELCERYGDRIKGLWFDGVYGLTAGARNQERLRETCLSFNPAMILTMNTGFEEGNLNPAPGYTCPDYRSWEVNRFVDFVKDMKFSRYQSAIVLACQGWWTTLPQATTFPLHAPEDIFKYIVAMSSVSTHGGFLASTGFYPVREGEDLNGDYFMNGIRDMLLDVNNLYLKPVEESIKNTKNSTAYPTKENLCVKNLRWGVANESGDGRYIYLHVLNAPRGQTLKLSAPADGTKLLRNAVIMNFDGSTTPVVIEETETGYAITLPDGISWNEVDTIIKAERILSDTPNDNQETTTAESDSLDGETTASEPGALDGDSSNTSNPSTDGQGCKSVVSISSMVMVLIATAATVVLKKRT